jgi:hypothetical protein
MGVVLSCQCRRPADGSPLHPIAGLVTGAITAFTLTNGDVVVTATSKCPCYFSVAGERKSARAACISLWQLAPPVQVASAGSLPG